MLGPCSTTLPVLRAVMPHLSAAKATEYLPMLVCAMVEGGIVGPLREAAFLAQLAHESGELRYFEEIASGEAYEGRKDLGNVMPGDGKRFKGRGPIQLTGRTNYRTAGRALQLDLEGHPEWAGAPEVGFRVASWYWVSRGLNELADSESFLVITHAINGGYNGQTQRAAYYAAARKALGLR